jgi:hypothetical protein
LDRKEILSISNRIFIVTTVFTGVLSILFLTSEVIISSLLGIRWILGSAHPSVFNRIGFVRPIVIELTMGSCIRIAQLLVEKFCREDTGRKWKPLGLPFPTRCFMRFIIKTHAFFKQSNRHDPRLPISAISYNRRVCAKSEYPTGAFSRLHWSGNTAVMFYKERYKHISKG